MAYHRGRSGRLYVGGPRGFNAFDPARVTPDRYAAPVAVSGVRVFDRRRPGLPRPTGDTLRLAHDQNHVAFDLAALDYVDPRAVRYRYRLAGVDDGWRTTDGRRPFGSYTGLAPGAYAFEVRATNHAGVASPHRARLRLVVTPAWWQTAWFRWGLALAGLGLVAGSVRARLAFLRRRQREQIHVQRRLAAVRERERQRLARDLHDGPMQELYRVGHDLDRLATLTPDHAGDVRATREAVGGVASVLRAVLVALRPPHLDALGLGAALRSLARQTERRHPALAVTTRLDVPDALDADAEYALYRITQEALANAAQHARAARVTVTLHAETDAAGARAAVLTVRDDGRGFAVPPRLLDLARDEHFGLVGAAERADALGGRLRVTSRPGHGTTVRAALPLARGGPEG
jgi:signal transduction histidine kinase